MKFAELEAEQQKPLAYKIDRACEAIEKAFFLSRHVPALAFSGGKDNEKRYKMKSHLQKD